MEPLKEMFNITYYKQLSAAIASIDKKFPAAKFIKDVTNGMEELSLNGRLRNTTVILRKYLPAGYAKSIDILQQVAERMSSGYQSLVFPDFVALYGQDHFDLSMDALKFFTSFGSSEFAIREFLKKDIYKTLRVMNRWADDKSYHVRRLSSEGSRPRLPWSFKLDQIIKDPSLTRAILEKLKEDDELYVRKSVANHLNDISKDNTAYMLEVLKSWNGDHPHTKWIIKHASRNLIKQGNKESLDLFAFEKNIKVTVEQLSFKNTTVHLGENLQFSFDMVSQKKSPQKLAIDYVIHYARPSGVRAKKVFKLKELTLAPNQHIHIVKKQLLKDFTTRKHYKGLHLLEINVNGKTLGSKTFKLVI